MASNPYLKSARLQCLDRCFKSSNGYTYDAIIAALKDNGISATKRTIQNDIKLLEEMGAEFLDCGRDGHRHTLIRYKDTEWTAFGGDLSDTEKKSIQTILERLDDVSDLPVFQFVIQLLKGSVTLESIDDINSYVDFGEIRDLDGTEHFGTLLKACIDKSTVSFKYHPFNSREFRMTVFPYMLKQYNGRWWVICRKVKSKKILTCALDRIASQVSTLSTPQFEEPSGGRDAILDCLRDTVGVTDAFKEPIDFRETVKLKVTNSRYPYLETKPILPMQEKVSSDDQFTIVSFPVKAVNKELVAKILEFGRDIEVLEPESLRVQVCDIVKQMASQVSVHFSTGPDFQGLAK